MKWNGWRRSGRGTLRTPDARVSGESIMQSSIGGARARAFRSAVVAALGASAVAAGYWAAGAARADTPRPGQQQAGQALDLSNDSLYGRDTTQGVYVRESTAAVEKLVQAQKMERLKEWAKAADYYEE